MAEAYIVDAVRTAGGRKGGALKDWHPADMAARGARTPWSTAPASIRPRSRT